MKEMNAFRITRSQQALNEFPIVLNVKIRCGSVKSSGLILVKMITY